MKSCSSIGVTLLFATTVLGVAAPGQAHGAILAVNPTADARFFSTAPTTNAGSETVLAVYRAIGIQHSVVLFNISSIPTSNTILSATLRLTADSAIFSGGQTAGQTSDIYRATAAWTESQVTWNDRVTATPWTTAGGDFVGTTGFANVSPYAVNSTIVPDGFSGKVNLTWDVTNLVAQWHTGAFPNLGLFLVGTGANELHFDSREISIAGDRPLLTIEFAQIPEPSTLSLLGLGAIGLAIKARRRRTVA